MPIVDELISLLTWKADTKDLDKAKDSIKAFESGVKKAGLALVGLAAGTAFLVKSTLGAIDKSAVFAESLGLNFEKMQELEFAAESTGGSISELRSDLESLTQSMNSPIPGEFNAGLAMLGVNTRKVNGDLKTSTEVVRELSKRFSEFDTQEALGWGKKLGLTPTTIKILRQGQEGLDKLAKEGRSLGAIVSGDSLESIREFEQTWSQLKRTFVSLVQTTVSGFAPALKDLIVQAKGWVKQNKELISTNIKKFILGVIKGFKIFVGVMRELKGPVMKFIDLLKPLVADMDAVEVITKAVVAILLSGFVIAVLAVVSKIITFILIIGKLLPLLGLLKTGIVVVLGALKGLSIFLLTNPIGILITVIAALIGLFFALKNKVGSAEEALKIMGRALIKNMLLPVNLLIKAFVHLLLLFSKIPKVGKRFAAAAKEARALQDDMNRALTGTTTIDPTKEIRETLFDTTKAIPKAAKSSISTSNVSNQSKQEVNITNHINGTQNPSAVAGQISKQVSDSLGLQVVQPGIRTPIID